MPRGGVREGAGHPFTGITTKKITINLPIEIYDQLEEKASHTDKSLNMYIRDIVINELKSGMAEYHMNMDMMMAAEETKPYGTRKSKSKK